MPICIAGMHRSGTSMVVRLLKECGLALGPETDLYLPAEDNPEGFWENKRFVELNNRLLSHLGGAWDVPPSASPGWEDDPALAPLAAKAAELIRSFEGETTWGWKDPRNSLTLPFWLKLIPELKVIVCLRNPVEVGRSLGKRGYSSDAQHNSLWLAYNEAFQKYAAPGSLLFTHYNSYFLDAETELRRLLDFAGIQASSTQVQLACAAASTSLRHHRATLESLSDAPASQEVARLYSKLTALAGPVFWGGLEPEVRALAESGAQEAEALVLLDRLVEIQHDMKAEMAEKAQKSRQSIAKLEERTQHLQGRLAAVQNELHTLQGSSLFQALHKYRALVERLLPLRTRRRLIYDRFIQMLRILATEGPKGLWKRWQTRRRAIAAYRRPKGKGTSKPAARGSVASKYAEVYSGLLAAASSAETPERVPLAETATPASEFPVKLLAFYLPQYHPIPENDEWWGRGFTEWSNVSKAVPQFVGHYQPHLPDELGFYDLRVQEVQRRQVELARHYGIHGFCFYYYWFNGKRLLERPLDAFTSDPEIDFPFCLCWANENWTRRWDGQESEILIAQAHSAESDFDFIRDLAPYFEHKNYIKIGGRPVLLVYRAQIMPDPAETARRWKSYCREHNLPEPYLVAAQTFGFSDPRQVGFDAAVEFPPHGIVIPEVPGRVDLLPQNFTGKLYDYQHVVGYMLQKERPEYPLFRTVMTSWDNTARRQESAHIFINNSPQAYKAWLAHDLNYTLQNPHTEERLVFINAWNEWAEGAHLEPDRKYGFAFLQATAEALRGLPAAAGEVRAAAPAGPFVKHHDTAVILHVFYPELFEEIASYLASLQGDLDLYVSIPQGVKLSDEEVRARFPEAQIYRCENRGRDVAPFLAVFSAIFPLNYKYVCKIHTKKTSHRENGGEWRTDILDKLLGSPAIVGQAKKMLDAELRVGLLAPRGHVLPSSHFMAKNEVQVMDLARRAGVDYGQGLEFDFVAGSMFWFKPLALAPLLFMDVTTESFEVEQGQKDGTLAHAFERFIGLLVQQNGFRIEEMGVRSEKSGYHYATARPRQAALSINQNPIIVYQMGKVGSMSVVDSLQRTFKTLSLDVPVHHRHMLNELDEIERAIRADRANPDETLREIQRGKELRRLIDSNPQQCWNLISLVRDPVARNVATFFQNLPEIVPDWRKQARNGTLDVRALQGTFLQINTIHGAPDAWFDRQLKPVFDIDVYASPFPVETGYKIYKNPPRARLLVLRLEDLDRVAGPAMHDFLGLEDFVIGHTNTTESKEYAAIYQIFKQIPLPAGYVNSMYGTRYARHFYSEEELEKFAQRWLGKPELH